MAIFLKNLYKYPGILNLKNTNNGIRLLARSRIFADVGYWQPVLYFHNSNFLLAKKIEEIKRRLREREYVSPRKRRKVCDVWEGMTVQELGEAMGKDADFVFQLMSYVNNTEEYEYPTDVLAWNVLSDLVKKANMAPRLTSRIQKEQAKEDKDVYPQPTTDESKLKPRPPVVTIMGHVDHGKTTLLDYLRKSSIVSSEFGGITQHIGAFSVKVQSSSITFLDTPGHAAFKAMRSRGAHCTDIVILVVAADDGVMEQTQESINMAKDANVPIIVAINKIDKRDADVELTKQMLMVQGLMPEDSGGDVQCVPISALKGTNIDALTEAIITEAELSNLRADPQGKVEGVIIESKIDPQKGKISTALIRQGTARKNCILTAGQAWCKVRQMLDEYGNIIKEAPPSTPVVILGWREIPIPGDIIIEVESEKRAHEVMECREKKAAEEKAEKELEFIELRRKKHDEVYKEQLKMKRKLGFRTMKPSGPREKESKDVYTGPLLNVVVKCDVEGSLEALLDSLYTYYDPRCKLDLVHSGVGNVTLGDVEIAEVFQAVIYNFNIGVLPDAELLAGKKGISIRPFNVIYRFLENVKKELNSRLPTITKERVTGEAVVQELFLITEGKTKNVPVAGCRCTSGDLKKNALYKVMRGDVEIFRGKLVSMRNMKTEVTSIKIDQECGLRFDDISVKFKPGDIIQTYTTYEVLQEVNWDPY